MSRRVEEVVIVGADAPAWMAACAIQLSLRGTGAQVRVVENPSLQRPVDIYAALPAVAGLHRQLGIEEQLLFDGCDAVPVMGQRFSNWSGPGTAFIHGYDFPTPTEAALSFMQLWLKGRRSGLRTQWESFSPGAIAAKAGRIPVPSQGSPPDSTYGYNIDARAYSQLLKRFAIQCGVVWNAAAVSNVELEGERISAIVLADGERVEADLFVDASGPQSLLIGRMPGTEFESWREWLPCDRLLVGSADALRSFPGYSQISATPHGWVGLFPLRDRTTVVAAYDSGGISDQEMAHTLPAFAAIPTTGEVVVSPLEQGVRKRNWVGNCVAVGESACSLEPLDSVQLHLAHYSISQLMSLFPVAAETFPQAELYDCIIQRLAANLRDYQVAHYKLNHRLGEPLWDRCRQSAIPDILQRKLDQFAARGRVSLYDDETFQEESWESLFIGHGLMPESYDPRVDAIPEQDQILKVHNRLTNIAEIVGGMPKVDEFLHSSSLEK